MSEDQPHTPQVPDLLSALLLEARKTTALLRLMAEQTGVEYWRVSDALEEAERLHSDLTEAGHERRP